MDEEIHKLSVEWKNWKFKNTALVIFSLAVFLFFAETPFIKNVIQFIGAFGYIGAFFVGILFVSVFTVGPASIVLFQLADKLNPLGVALAAGTGGMFGDYLILRFLKDKVFEELKPLYMDHGGRPLKKLFKTPYFAWAIPILGAILIMSPLPDEVGLGLMGISKMKTWKLLGLLYLLDVAGIFLIVIAARSF